MVGFGWGTCVVGIMLCSLTGGIFLFGWHMCVCADIHTKHALRCSYWDGLCVAEMRKLGEHLE